MKKSPPQIESGPFFYPFVHTLGWTRRGWASLDNMPSPRLLFDAIARMKAAHEKTGWHMRLGMGVGWDNNTIVFEIPAPTEK